jgi:CHAT domain-containing protein/tetratricopeptide (TPR) repeat protein
MRNEPMYSDCPSNETLAALVDSKLSPRERQQVMQHMTTCDNDCYDTFLATSAAKREVGDGAAVVAFPDRSRRSLVWGAFAAAVAAAFAAAFLVPQFRDRLPFMPKHGIAALIAASGPTRDIEARLSGFPYQPKTIVNRGPADEEGPNEWSKWRLSAAQEAVKEDAAGHPSAETHHALGVSYLLSGLAGKAVDQLVSSESQHPDARTLADLSAAYLARSKDGKHPRDPVAAVDAAEKALALSPDSAEALFNRALALEELQSPNADQAWKDYLRVDPSSQWSVEARKHLSHESSIIDFRSARAILISDRGVTLPIAEEIAHNYPRRTRACVVYDLLPEWAADIRAHQLDRAKSVLTSAAVVASAIAEVSHDPSVSELVKDVDQEWASGNERRVDALVSGFTAVSAAGAAMKDHRYADAAAAYDKTSQFLAGAPAAVVDFVATSHVLATYSLGHFDDALNELAAADVRQDIHAYPIAFGERQWYRALALLSSGRPHEALMCYRDALSRFEEARDESNVAFLHTLIAENLTALGDDGDAWEERAAGLKALRRFNDSSNTQIVLNEMAEAAMLDGYQDAALLFQDEVVRLATFEGEPQHLAYALMWRGLIRSRLRVAGVADDFRLAFADADRIQDSQARARTVADLNMSNGFALEETDTPAAIQHCSDALRHFRSIGYRFRSAQLLLERGRMHRRNNNADAALADFVDGISEIEQQSQGVVEERLRAIFFGRADDLYSEAVGVLADRGEYDEALKVAERGRERVLTDSVVSPENPTDAAVATEDINTLRSDLPSGTLLVEYAVLPQEVIVWVISPSGVRTLLRNVDLSHLEDLIEALRNGIVKQTNIDRVAGDLYDILARGVVTDSVTSLVIIPDGPLNDLPFAVLLDRERHRYLLASTTIVVAPSIRMFARSRNEVARRSQGGQRTLAFGGSRFNDAALRDLPAVPDELKNVALCHRPSTILVDETATAERFKTLAPQANIIQFAGHAIVNVEDPSLSSLIFGPAKPDGSNRLYVHDLVKLRLKSRLVVLSACATAARSGAARQGGASSIARAFLRAGVPTVIATLWDIQDGSAAPLIERLHREIDRGMSASEALRTAQLQMLHSSDPHDRDPAAWAAYQILGSM